VTSIQTSGVSKRHQGEWVLRDITLDVDDGEYLGLIGPGGAGKSLLLKIIAGLVEPDAGRVEVDGIDVHALSEAERDELRMRIGMLFQNYALFDSMTVAENIAFPLRQADETGEAKLNERVDGLLDEIGLPHARDKYPKDLSGGMKKRVSFARAVVRRPPILLYDDPTAGLDPVTGSKIFRLLETLQQDYETTAVTVSHDLKGIRTICDRIAMLDEGRLIFDGTIDEIATCEDAKVRDFWEDGQFEGPAVEGTREATG
jgi:phospholipid/cholesterol/gamma-HCH transport system ATP-binding protein